MKVAGHLCAGLLVLALLAPGLRGDDPREAARCFERAQQAERDKRYSDASQAIKQAIDYDPSNPQYQGFAAWIYLESKDYASGLHASEKAVELARGRNDAFFHFLAGECAYNDQEVELAIKYFKRAAERGERDLTPQNYHFVKERLELLAEKSYELDFRIDPRRAPTLKRKDGSFAFPIPSRERWPFQKVDRVTVVGARSHKIEELEGNDIIALTPEGDNTIRLLINVTVRPFSYKQRLSRRTKSNTFSALVKPYLGSSEWIDIDSRVMQKVVEPLRRPDKLETAAEIVAYLRKELRYIPNENLQNASDVNVELTLRRAQASCHGWSAAFAGLCRTAGVPARMVVVLSTKDNHFEFHDIVEVYIPNSGWVPVEPQPGGVTGMPGTSLIRLYHYVPTRRWAVNDPEKIHLFNMLGALCEGKPTLNVAKK